MKVSVAIPCFNAGRWLRSAVESALSQCGGNVEVIVVDDGSTDDSPRIAQAFSDRVRLIRAENGGANRARNIALDLATGEWIQFLDADDYLEPHKIETQLREADDGRNADLLYSPVWIETCRDGHSSRELSITDPYANVDLQWIRWQIPQTGGALWRRNALNQIGGWNPDQPCCQEHELYLRARQGGFRFVYTPTPGAVYRIWSEDTLCRKDPANVVQVRTELLERMRDWLKSKGTITDAHRIAIGQACFEMARTWARFDLEKASAYHRARNSVDSIRVVGPAAPLSYRMIYHLLGFARTERIARVLRSRSTFA